MITQLKATGKYNITIFLIAMSIFCFSLSLFRFWISERNTFLFLNWNLFLAFIPWMATTILVLSNFNNNKVTLLGLLIIWLLFFPNSPYILTDLFHLQSRAAIPVWFDLILILSFAWTGLTSGFISLFDIETFLKKQLNHRVVEFIIVIMLFLGSFGVYLGRYLRWNSWDIISEPTHLLLDVGDRFINPTLHPRTWGVTILLGILLNMMYWTFKYFKTEEAK